MPRYDAVSTRVNPAPEGITQGVAEAARTIKALDIQVDGTHYKNMAIQPIEFCQRNKLNFCESNVIKYVCRHRDKNGARDLKKAIHNLQIILELEYPE